MNNLYDYFNSINDKEKISHSFLIGNVNFDSIKNDLYRVLKDFIFKNDNIENNPDIYIIRPVNGNISKEDINNLIDELSITSQFNNNKVYIIDSAERLNDYSYNAILKTLEEPQDNIYAFLITNNINLIKSTISSRCQKIFISSESNIEVFDDKIVEVGNKFIDYIEKNGINTIGINYDIYNIIDSRDLLNDVLNYMLKKYFDNLNDLIYNNDEQRNNINLISEKILIINNAINNSKYYLNKNLLIDRIIIEMWRCNNENS